MAGVVDRGPLGCTVEDSGLFGWQVSTIIALWLALLGAASGADSPVL